MYYWPQASPNTACLSAFPPITSSYPHISNPYTPNILRIRYANLLTLCSQSPSVYAVFPTIHGWDGCNTIGAPFFNLTTSFAIGKLSTVGLNNSTYSFNFGDLPCPPADVEWDPFKGPYAPKVAAPGFLWNLDPMFANCIPGANQGIDPPTTLIPAPAVSPQVCHPPFCHPPKRASKRAHLVPWAPEKTAEPTS